MTDATTSASSTSASSKATQVNSPARVLLASVIGTTIEFFDFYIYATAAVLVFPTQFFPATDPTAGTLASFAALSIAFFARPFGAVVFGHFGDRIGRKTTLVAALLTMGISTVLIGLLPTYGTIGVFAPLLLALCRFGQGFGLGGEWGGAVLLATENAPEGKQNWYGMFPQLGAPLGLFLASGAFWLLLNVINSEQLLNWGWRIPFLASIVLIAVGLWVRLSIHETPEFQKAIVKHERVAVPVAELFRNYKRSIFLSTFVALATFVLFYISTAWLLAYSKNTLNITPARSLEIQLAGSIAFGIFIPIVGKLAERFGRREMLIITTVLIALFSFSLPVLLGYGEGGVFAFIIGAMALMGMTYGLIGTALAAPFPTNVRYTGASMTFNLAGIFGASFAPFIALKLQAYLGLAYVGYYLGAAALITFACILASKRNEV